VAQLRQPSRTSFEPRRLRASERHQPRRQGRARPASSPTRPRRRDYCFASSLAASSSTMSSKSIVCTPGCSWEQVCDSSTRRARCRATWRPVLLARGGRTTLVPICRSRCSREPHGASASGPERQCAGRRLGRRRRALWWRSRRMRSRSPSAARFQFLEVAQYWARGVTGVGIRCNV
jgi:hypothetical protein